MRPEKDGMSVQVLCLRYVGKETARIFSSGSGYRWALEMGCTVDCMLKRSFYYHLYCTPKGGHRSLFTESLSVVGLGDFF